MATDKVLIALLLGAFEEACIDRTIYTAMLATVCDKNPKLGAWEPVFQRPKAKNQQAVLDKFATVRKVVEAVA